MVEDVSRRKRYFRDKLFLPADGGVSVFAARQEKRSVRANKVSP